MVNAFWLDHDCSQTARWLVDRHVCSSLFECSMVLTTAVQLNGHDGTDLYFSYENHPLTRWAADSHENWTKLYEYTEHAHEEWRYRWDHDQAYHASWVTVLSLDDEVIGELDWPSEEGGDPPQLTGRWKAHDYVDAYRLYYANEKRALFSWTKDRNPPPWIGKYTMPERWSDHPYA